MAAPKTIRITCLFLRNCPVIPPPKAFYFSTGIAAPNLFSARAKVGGGDNRTRFTQVQLHLPNQRMHIVVSMPFFLACALDLDPPRFQSPSQHHITKRLSTIFPKLCPRGAILVRSPQLTSSKIRKHFLIDVSMVIHTVDIRPKTLLITPMPPRAFLSAQRRWSGRAPAPCGSLPW